jgi:hypothetical protein
VIELNSSVRYNSAIFSTLSAVDYTAFVVTEDFVHGAWWNRTRPGEPSFTTQASSLQQDVGKLTRLENVECLQAYGTSMFETDWKNVLVVTSLERNDTLMGGFDHSPDSIYNDITWVCNGDPDGSCDIKSLISKATSWTIPGVADCQHYTDGECDRISAPIQYCLAEPFVSDCSVRVNTMILLVVVICNIVKIASLLTTVFSARFEPIITLGDAISSFVQRTDPFTIAAGALSRADVDSAAKRRTFGCDGWASSPYQRKTYRWAFAVGVKRWMTTILL